MKLVPVVALLASLMACAATVENTAIPVAPVAEAPDVLLPVRVLEVVDGDTIDATLDGVDESVRLLGVNAPERDECLGDEAGRRLAALLDEADVGAETAGRDEFGRVLAFLWVDGRLANLDLVAEGLVVTPSQSDHRLAETFEAAADDARAAGVGLWAPDACGPAAGGAVRIADLVHDARGPDDQNPNGEWVDLENTGDTVVDLEGWVLRDESTRHRYRFAAGTVLDPGGTLRVYSGCGEDSPGEAYWCDGDPVWSNSGDTALLQDPNGNIVDEWTYTG